MMKIKNDNGGESGKNTAINNAHHENQAGVLKEREILVNWKLRAFDEIKCNFTF